MAEIRWAEEAATWLEDIYSYIAVDDPGAAQRVVSGIYEKAQILRDFPRLGYQYRLEPEGEVRVLLYGHYRIAYLLRADDSAEVLGVFHGALDIERYLWERSANNASERKTSSTLLATVRLSEKMENCKDQAI